MDDVYSFNLDNGFEFEEFSYSEEFEVYLSNLIDKICFLKKKNVNKIFLFLSNPLIDSG